MMPSHRSVLLRLVVAAGLLSSGGAALADSAWRAFGEPGRPEQARRSVTVVMRDNVFDRQRIEVRAGETVRFVVRNEGELLHEFNIGTKAMHAAHQREMQAMAESGMLTATGMNHAMPAGPHAGHGSGAMAHDDPNSVLVEPGKTGELVFRFTRAATLEFACDLPGHYQAGMVGTLISAR